MPTSHPLCLVTLLIFAATAALADPLILAQDRTSPYCVYLDAAAPEPVQFAAQELVRVVEIATGVKLPVVHEPKSPMICLGESAAATAAGATAQGLPEEGFRIEAKGQDLYIIGVDTPDGATTAGGGCSQGTLFGVYDVLERFVGVRWVMPGEMGEDIPRLTQLRGAQAGRGAVTQAAAGQVAAR